MELRHLRYFVAVAEALSFRRAAERLHLTRPALSKQIRELEEEIGARLFDRDTARVSLTAAGIAYQHEVRDILERTKQAGVIAREAAEGKRGTLSIGDAGVLGLTFLTAVLTTYRGRYPGVEVMVNEIPPERQAAAVASGEVGVGFATRKQVEAEAGLDSFIVSEFRIGVAVGAAHPLALRKTLRARDLAGEPLLCVGPDLRSEHAGYTRDLLFVKGAPKAKIRSVSGYGALLTMISSGHGAAFLPQSLRWGNFGHVVVVPFESADHPVNFELLATWRRDDQSPTMRNFVRLLRGFLREVAA